MKSTSGRFSASSAPAVPVPASSASNAWTYWLIRCETSPPVSVVSPRWITGLSRCRFSAATMRCPLWVPTRIGSSRSEGLPVMGPRLERVPVSGNRARPVATVRDMASDPVLVSAADGPLPQTVDQMRALKAQGATSVDVVITNTDVVDDAELLELVELEIRDLAEKSGL